MERRSVLVTGTGGRSVGSGVLHALSRTGATVRDRWRVVAVDADSFAWGLYKGDAAAIVPLANSPEYIPTLRRLVDEHQIAAILPGTEPEIRPLVENAAKLAPAVVIANRLELLPLMLDKFACTAKLTELGLRVIPTAPLTEWQRIASEYGFPLIVKPTVGTGGSRGLEIVRDEQEMTRLVPRVDLKTAPCVQPYVGDADAEYTVGVLSDFEGRVIDSIVMRRKLIGLSLLTSAQASGRRAAISTGYSQGFIVRDAGIQKFCEDLAVKLDSRGPLNVQLRIEPRTGEPLVFEIHPRFSGTTPIRADVGFNEPDVLLRHALDGEQFGRLDYRSEVAAIRAFEHVIVPFDQMLQ